jgi:hypothetical protein
MIVIAIVFMIKSDTMTITKDDHPGKSKTTYNSDGTIKSSCGDLCANDDCECDCHLTLTKNPD